MKGRFQSARGLGVNDSKGERERERERVDDGDIEPSTFITDKIGGKSIVSVVMVSRPPLV
jgi:hypothetical protein